MPVYTANHIKAAEKASARIAKPAEDTQGQYEIRLQLSYLLAQLEGARIAAHGDLEAIAKLDNAKQHIACIARGTMSMRSLSGLAEYVRAATKEAQEIHSTKMAESLNAAAKKGVLLRFATMNFVNTPYVRFGKVTDLAAFAREFGYEAQMAIMRQVNNVFADDSAAFNNPHIQALTATMAQLDSEVAQAQQKAKNAADIVANNATAILRSYQTADTAVRAKMLEQFEHFKTSRLLSAEDKQAIETMSRMLREGAPIEDAMIAARSGETLNNLPRLRHFFVMDRAGQMHKVTVLETPGAGMPPAPSSKPLLEQIRDAGKGASRAGAANDNQAGEAPHKPIVGSGLVPSMMPKSASAMRISA